MNAPINRIVAGIFLCGFILSPAYGETGPAETASDVAVVQDQLPGLDAYSPLPEEVRHARTRNLFWGAVAAVGIYGAKHWWQDGMTSHFSTVNEHWFGQDTYAGGADKLGHGFSTYAGTRLLMRGFEWAGNDPQRSLWLAAGTSLATLTGVEVLDGYSKRFRFSKEDAIMNLAGVGAAVLLERHPALDAVLDLRLQYWPSADARRLNEVDPIGDHSGQTYLAVFKAAGMPLLRKTRPLRYLELAVGYGSRGYEPNDGTPGDRSRHVYYGISLNLAEIFNDTFFRQSRGSTVQRITNTVLEFVQVPGTAMLADHRL